MSSDKVRRPFKKRASASSARRRLVEPKLLSECLLSVDSPEGRKRVIEYLKSLPYPHYEATRQGLLVKIEANGKRTVGHFVGRAFRPIQKGRR